MKQTCQTCRYWQQRPKESKGSCHANPPLGLGFPLTLADDWCGRWQAQEQKEKGRK